MQADSPPIRVEKPDLLYRQLRESQYGQAATTVLPTFVIKNG